MERERGRERELRSRLAWRTRRLAPSHIHTFVMKSMTWRSVEPLCMSRCSSAGRRDLGADTPCTHARAQEGAKGSGR